MDSPMVSSMVSFNSSTVSWLSSFLTKKLIKQMMIGTTSAATMAFLWEHFCKKNEINFRPSRGLTVCAKYTKYWSERAGKFVSWLSSYLTAIDMNDLLGTASDLVKPMAEISKAPYYFCRGYYRGAIEYVNGTPKKTWLIYTGSAIGVSVICFLTTRYQLWAMTKTFMARLPTMMNNLRAMPKITNQ